MKRLSVVTLESSSIKILTAKINYDGYFKIIDEIITPISTSEIFLHHKFLSEKILLEIDNILNSYSLVSSNFNSDEVISMATSIYNDISNKDALSNLFIKNLNSNLKYLSNKDEAYYDYLNLSNSIYYKSALVIETAGYSTNFCMISNKKIINSMTLPIGSINISYTYNLQDRASKENLSSALTHIHKELLKLKAFKTMKYDSVYFIGDTIQCLNRIDRYKKNLPLTIAHNYITSDVSLIDIFNIVKSKSHVQRNRLEGMSSHLASTIVGGAAIIYEIIDYFKASTITISNRNINDSIIFEYIDNNYDHIEDILDYSLYGMINNLNINKKHAKHIYDLTLLLFNKLKPLHRLNSSYEKVIKTASLLHDAGISINYYNHHKHSFYLILSSYINGLTHKELFLSASIAASHRNRDNYNFSFGEYAPFANKYDTMVINKISILLRIAESLDISMNSSVKDIDLEITENSVILDIIADKDITLEITEARKCIRKFKEIYDRNLIININKTPYK